MPKLSVQPYCLLFCSQILHDDEGRRSLIGLFDRIQAPEFPVMLPKLAVFVGLIGELSGVELTLRIKNVDGVSTSVRIPTAPRKSNSDRYEYAIAINGVPFIKAGNCLLEVVHEDNVLISRNLEVVHLTGEVAEPEGQQ